MELSNAVPGAVKQVFGEMFFTYVAEAAEGGEEPRPYALESEIGFTGDMSGRMRIAFSKRLAEQVAANLVGGEPAGLQEDQVLDAVKEAANILCCNLLRLAGAQTIAVSIPVARPFQEESLPGDAFEFDAEGEPLRVVVRLEDAGRG
jgi:CheY-specific phosphatase CheX